MKGKERIRIQDTCLLSCFTNPCIFSNWVSIKSMT
jgi:hypothetical protein